jgi:uncharacterized protein (UPF0210 family)
MKIRTITLGTNLRIPLPAGLLPWIQGFMEAARRAFAEAGFEVQTVRLTTQPFAGLLDGQRPQDAVAIARTLENACLDHGVDYLSLGTIHPASGRHLIPLVPEILAATRRSFLSVTVATAEAGIDLDAVRRTAAAVGDIASRTPEGFGNHNFAALACCPPHIPFFPAAYHAGPQPTFTLGLETAALVHDACAAATSLLDARQRLIHAVEDVAARLQTVAARLAAQHDVAFGGLDLSTAPFPGPDTSTARAIELLGAGTFGAPGTLFAAALIADALRRCNVPRTGYSGLFLPLLEDSVLATRNAEGAFTLDSLLLYSAVCGAGLDAIPLPGDIAAEALAAIILDVAALAVVLDKPLGARLVPIPGKQAGDLTGFDYPYFANTRVVAPTPSAGSPPGILLSRDSLIHLTTRRG